MNTLETNAIITGIPRLIAVSLLVAVNEILFPVPK